MAVPSESAQRSTAEPGGGASTTVTWVTGITRMSVLYEQPQEVWERVSTFAGVNDEFGPLLRMSAPAGARIDATVPIGRRWFRSRLLLFGVLPVEYDDLVFTAIEPGRRFNERSSMLTLRVWEHERSIEPDPDGCIVRDNVSWQPRFPLPDLLVRAIVDRAFEHRHRRLRRHFGGRPLPPQR